MGIEDRDWYRAERRQQRELQRVRDSVSKDRQANASEWASIRASLWRSLVTFLAIYGAGQLLLKLFRWATS